MADSDQVEDRTFRVSFSADGAAKLRECVRGKLKEFMGDYTDDTLVEYVVVLLRNGRRKEEARNELNVFLGDDTDSFVSWLWSHLSSSLDLYVQHTEPYLEEAAKRNGLVEHQATQNDSYQRDSDFEREKFPKESKSRRNREWKGLVRDAAEPPPLRSSEVENFYSEEKLRRKTGRVKRSRSSQSPTQKKQSYQDDKQLRKRELPSHPIVSAPRRLLQFAVRDAVGTLRPSSSRMEPALKRLRSVVSRATEYPSHNDQYHGMRSSGRLPSAVAIAVKAAAEAAEDASMGRFSGNVFDRLGHTTDASEMTNQSLGFQRNDMEIEEGEEYDQIAGESCNFVPRNEYGTGRQLSEKTPMADENDLTSYDYGSDNDGYDNVNIINHRGVDNSLVNPSRGNKDEDTLMVQYSVANNTDELVKRARVKDQKSPPAAGNRKIVNISVNVNTWKPPAHYQGSEHIREKENLIVNKGKETAKSKPLSLVKENNHMLLPTKESEQTSMIVQKEPSKTASSVTATGSVFTGRPLEDADSRTIFVSNVHFAATKDTLSRHFNKFGDVLKVTIVIDAATGQPKGSAYVEFMRKEAAEHALSLDGTSFMSRILKVVKKSAAYQEASNMVSWPRLARGSPYTGRLVRGTFPRGFPGAFRSRLPIKAGARSLQWKRDAQITPTTENTVNVQLGTAGASSNSSVPSPTARSLTYVRKESKPDGDAGTA